MAHAALMLAVSVGVQVGIVEAARTPDGHLPTALLAGPLLVFLVGLGVVMARVLGGRYAEQPDLV